MGFTIPGAERNRGNTKLLMSTMDAINAVFEFAGSIAVWRNIVQIRADKGYAGLSIWAVVFFTTWGAWNLAYYPSLGQWLSFAAGCSIFLFNCWWIMLLLVYGKKENNETKTENLDRMLQRPPV
jgi:hypothetical protein